MDKEIIKMKADKTFWSVMDEIDKSMKALRQKRAIVTSRITIEGKTDEDITEATCYRNQEYALMDLHDTLLRRVLAK